MQYDFSDITPRGRENNASAELGLSERRSFELFTLVETDLEAAKRSGASEFDALQTITKRVNEGNFTPSELMFLIYSGYVSCRKVKDALNAYLKPYRIFMPIGVGACIFTLLTILNALLH